MLLRFRVGSAPVLLATFLFVTCSSGGQESGPVAPVPPIVQKGSIRVTTRTTGDEYSLDRDGFTVVVDDLETARIATNGTMNFLDLSVGSHVVKLEEVVENCTVTGENPRQAGVQPDNSTPVDFSITCATLTGTIVVQTLTSGSSQDPDGYSVSIDGEPAQAIGINDTKTYPDLATGSHDILLGGLDGGCALHSPNPRTVILFGNSTSQSNFHVEC